MDNTGKINKKTIHYLLFAAVTVLFIATRLFRLDSVPFTAWGMELDELGAAYDAWCIQGWGVDRNLIKMPVMFLNTGNGQNALYIYLAALIFKLFGFSLFKFRMVAVICAGAAFICMYFLSRMIYDTEPRAIIPVALMTVMPVYMMSEHWGLESYLFLSFSIISFYFLVRAVKSGCIRDYVIDGILWGITFYTYGISYVVVPLFLGLSLAYLIYLNKIKWKMVAAEAVPMILLGIPLAVEQLVIAGIIAPFSLKYMDFFTTEGDRWREISPEYILDNIRKAPYVLFVHDSMWEIDSPNIVFGTVFYISIPFLISGLVLSFIRLVRSLKKKEYDIYAHVFVFYIIAQLVALMTSSLRVVSANEIYFPFLVFTSLGIVSFISKVNKKSVSISLAAVYSICFLVFAKWMYSGGEFSWNYATRPRPELPIYVDIHAAQAASEIKKKYGDKPVQMIINDGGKYWYLSICLFTGAAPYEYKYKTYKGDGYAIGIPESLDTSGETAYLIQDSLHHITDYLVSEGFTNEVTKYGEFSMVTKQTEKETGQNESR